MNLRSSSSSFLFFLIQINVFNYLFCLNNLDCASIVVVVVHSAYVLKVRFGSVGLAVYRPLPAADRSVEVVVRKRVAIHALQRNHRLLHDHRSLWILYAACWGGRICINYQKIWFSILEKKEKMVNLKLAKDAVIECMNGYVYARERVCERVVVWFCANK